MRELYRDRWLLVVDKPAGLPTQPAPGSASDLYALLCAAEPYVGLHHRLDQAASGLVLVTLDPSVNAAIAQGFREHAIRRLYRAVATGEVRDGTWDRPIDGKAAKTQVRRVGHRGGATAIECALHTGRHHQIRVHAAMAGRPLVGDRRYGGRRHPRLALHGARLEWTHPITGEEIRVDSPLPDELLAAWEAAGGERAAAGGIDREE
jgi:23S rRNA-/tRNA-specific pseudouridylate synthase